MQHETLRERLNEYTFYQTVDLGDGVTTPGRPRERKQECVLRLIRSLDLTDKRAIDLGCANGLYAIEAERSGAGTVVAVDHTSHNIRSLNELVLPHLGSRIDARCDNFFDVAPEIYGDFDLVVCAGLLYHLRYPFWAFRILRDLVRADGTLILETGIFDDFNRRQVLYCPSPAFSPQKSRHANACSYFNERALLDTLAYFGFRVEHHTIVNARSKRFAKKLAGLVSQTYYPTSNMVVQCRRDPSIENAALRNFYEDKNL